MKTTFDKLVIADPFGERRQAGFLANLNDIRLLDPAIRNIYRIFGLRTLLLPLGADGTPATESSVGWKSITLADTFGTNYQANLRRSHLAVRTGIPSDNLCAVQFREQKHRDQFLKLNPAAQSTLITGCPKGTVLDSRFDTWSWL